MRALRTVLGRLDAIPRVAGVVAAVLLAAMFTLMLAEVVSRNLAGRSLHVSWEVSSYLMAAVVFLAAGPALDRDVHVRVGILPGRLRPRALAVLEVAVTLVGLAVAGYLAWALSALTWRSWSGGVMSWTGFGIPLWLPQGVATAGAWLLALQLLVRLGRIFAGLSPDRAEPSAAPSGR